MEISTEIDTEKNIRWHVVKGVIDLRETAEYLKGIYASSASNSEMNVFWDLQTADFSAVSSDDVRTFMAYVSKIWGKPYSKGSMKSGGKVRQKDIDYTIKGGILSFVFSVKDDKESLRTVSMRKQ